MAERRGAGQASVELIAALPALLLAGLVCLQLLALGYTLTIIDGAAEAGALAAAAGERVEPAVREALPGWARGRVEVEAQRGAIDVRVRPPAVVPGLGDRLEIATSARVRAAR